MPTETIIIPLTHGKSMIIDKSDFELISLWKWILMNPNKKRMYALGRKDLRAVMAHRLIMGEPKNLKVDHINGNTLDNRRCNLRICTNAQNSRNRTKPLTIKTSSKYKGVSLERKNGRWNSKIKFNYKIIHIGVFGTEEEAARAYDEKAIELFGEFARPNFA